MATDENRGNVIFSLQIETLQKALLNQETAPKEKHVRSIRQFA